MANKNRFTQKEMIDALRVANGNLSVAAKTLRCSRDTVARYAAKFPKVQAARDEAREAVIDLAENKFLEHVNQGNWKAIQFALNTIGKDRGYFRRLEIQLDINDLKMLRELLSKLETIEMTPAQAFQNMIHSIHRHENHDA